MAKVKGKSAEQTPPPPVILDTTTRFDKDVKRQGKRGKSLNKLHAIIEARRNRRPLDPIGPTDAAAPCNAMSLRYHDLSDALPASSEKSSRKGIHPRRCNGITRTKGTPSDTLPLQS